MTEKIREYWCYYEVMCQNCKGQANIWIERDKQRVLES